MSLKGFDTEFQDLTDYILKITYRIWEEKEVKKIGLWYAKNASVYTPTSITENVQDVIRSTYQTLQMFPDRQLFAQDIIGKEYLEGIYYSSHRIFSPMTHKGDGIFGKATNKKVKTKIIADCICQNNKIIQEWMVRDQSAIVKDIGLDVETFGRAQGRAMKENKLLLRARDYKSLWHGGPQSYEPNAVVQKIVVSIANIFNGNFDDALQVHNRACQVYFPQATIINGSIETIEYWNSVASCFTQAEFSLNHWIQVEEPNEPIRIALRWNVLAQHQKQGRFGEPSNKEIALMAISHFELRKGKILRADHLWDELSIWGQIEAGY